MSNLVGADWEALLSLFVEVIMILALLRISLKIAEGLNKK